MEKPYAAYEEARSQLSLANIDLSYCIVKAPFTGRISRNMVDPGNMVGTDANNSALATIYKDNQMYLYFNMACASGLCPVTQEYPVCPRSPYKT